MTTETATVSTAEQAQQLRDRLTIDRIARWVEGAQPRARLTYGLGDFAWEACSAELAAEMRRWCARGFVLLFRRRRLPSQPGFGFEFIAVRTEREWRAGALPGADLVDA